MEARDTIHPTLSENVLGVGLVLLGTISGAVIGLLAGPPGVIVGALMGCSAGTMLGAVLDSVDVKARRHDDELDHVIGVIGGDIGVKHPIPEREVPDDFKAAEFP
jgi:zinc transporter ZupT